jgi:hypothetical protein
MAFQEGNKLGGRKVGSLNKTNEKIRETIAKLTDQKFHHLDTAFESVREENPGKYIELYLRLLEYTTPKLRSIDTKIDAAEGSISKITIEVKEKPSE